MSQGLPPISVQPLQYERVTDEFPAKWWRVPVVGAICLLAAWSIGAFTNLINGHVSLVYFQAVVGWMYGTMSAGDVVLQGLLESTVFGVLFCFAMTLTYLTATRARCPLIKVVNVVATCTVICIVLWTVAGAIGLAWGSFAPLQFTETFELDPFVVTQPGQWGWVGGSIWGIYLGGFVAIVGGPIRLYFVWKALYRKRRPFNLASV